MQNSGDTYIAFIGTAGNSTFYIENISISTSSNFIQLYEIILSDINKTSITYPFRPNNDLKITLNLSLNYAICRMGNIT